MWGSVLPTGRAWSCAIAAGCSARITGWSAPSLLEAHSSRALGKRAVHDIIEIGRRLNDAKTHIPHKAWLPWLEEEQFGWSKRTAQRFMSVAELASKSDTVPDLSVDMRGLYLLAASSTANRETIFYTAETRVQWRRPPYEPSRPLSPRPLVGFG
jgi:hypothetical protein